MFKENECAIHKKAGAVVVEKVISQDMGNGLTQYYYLRPLFPTAANKSLEIYLPIENENMLLRKPLSKEDVNTLIQKMPSMEKIWYTDAKTRKTKFEEIYHDGKIEELCKLVKLLYVEQDFLTRPMNATDKNFLKKIRNNIFDEFAVALNINPNEVEEYVKKYLEK